MIKKKFAQLDKFLLVIAIVSQIMVLLLVSPLTKSPLKTTSLLDGLFKMMLIK
jgi:hypothetical protein